MDNRIIIAGSRDFNDYELLERTLNEYFEKHIADKSTVLIISGGAADADSLGERYAKTYGIILVRCRADWKRYGRAAGPKRNEEMARLSMADGAAGILFAFWDGESKGTRNMINLAKKYAMEIHIIKFSK